MNKCIAEVYLRLADTLNGSDILEKKNYGFVKVKAVFLQWGLDVSETGSYTVAIVELEEFVSDVVLHSSEYSRCEPGRVFKVDPEKIKFLNQ